MKHGARNDIPAQITRIKTGAVMCQVDATIVGTDYKVSSVMTVESLESMGLKVGDKVHVVIKAVNVLLTRD
ncbi:MAG: molybdopterin-binding protein [Pseudorhodoplanes sp.]